MLKEIYNTTFPIEPWNGDFFILHTKKALKPFGFQRFPILISDHDRILTYNLLIRSQMLQLGAIYHQTKHKGVAFTKLAQWYDRVDKTQFLSFGTVTRTIQSHYETILNYFDNRSTNASAESFNAKIKSFRASFRGVRDIRFFLFRLSKIYA